MRRTSLAAISLALLGPISCTPKAPEAENQGTLLVTTPLRTDTEQVRGFVAQIKAIQHIEIRALERGYLQEVLVDEGQQVKKNQKLFQIRPALYDAELQKATASAQLTQIELANTQGLARKNVVSSKELAMAKARASESAAKVQLANTRKAWTSFNAPFDGLVGRFRVRIGSLVEEGDLMTTLSDTSMLWVYFNVSEPEYLDFKKHFPGDKGLAVKLMMANGQMYGPGGTVQTVESDFDNATGNIAFRAGFSNPNGLLRHGETGKILITTPMKNVLLIPQEATFDVLDQKFVYVLDAKNAVHARAITIAAELPQVFVVASGLAEQDKILVEGLRRVTEGDVVVPAIKPAATVIKSLEVPAE